MSRLLVGLVGLVGLSLSMLIGCLAPVRAQDVLPEEESITSHTISVPSLEAVVARKAAVQARLEALGPVAPDNNTDTDTDPQQDIRQLLEQLLATLTPLEAALTKQATMTTQSEEIAQRLSKLTAKSKRPTTRRPKTFANPTDQLRDEYQTKLQAAQS